MMIGNSSEFRVRKYTKNNAESGQQNVHKKDVL